MLLREVGSIWKYYIEHVREVYRQCCSERWAPFGNIILNMFVRFIDSAAKRGGLHLEILY